MGRYDNISDERLRAEVARFARILQRMEVKGETLDRTADILKLLGELRRMVFAWEVRCTWDDEGEMVEDDSAGPDAGLSLSERIVAEATRREEELREEFDRRFDGTDDHELENDDGREGDEPK